MNCETAISELLRLIDRDGTSLSPDARAHLRECENCRTLLESIAGDAPAPDARVDATTPAETAVRLERRKVIAARVLAVMATVIVFLGPLLVLSNQGVLGVSTVELIVVLVGGISVAMILASPFLLLFTAARRGWTGSGKHRFYRRLGPGRWLEGVCLGIAETMEWRVAYVRLAFVLAAIFSKGLAVLVYLICASAMAVHPADRQYLLRFKIARLWRRMRGHEIEEHV
jgi:phage shock protein PspC (stress-responsive transcriptional regulator)